MSWLYYIALFILLSPYLWSFRHYSFDNHVAALKKSLILWGISSSPVLLTLLAAYVKTSKVDWAFYFGYQELFVYSTAFLAPVLYMVFEIFDQDRNVKKADFSEFGLLLVPIIILLFSEYFYVSQKLADPNASNEPLPLSISFGIYVVCVFAWHFSILFGVYSSRDFINTGREIENDLARQFSEKIKGRSYD